MSSPKLPNTSRSGPDGPEQYLPLRRVTALYYMGASLLRAPSEAAAFETAVQSLVEDAHYGNAWILTVDQEAQMLRGQVAAGVGIAPAVATMAFPLADPGVHTAIQVACTGIPVVVPDLVAQADREGWGDVARAARLRSAAYVPFGPPTAPWGTLTVSMFTDMDADEETTLLGLFAMHLTTALERLHNDRERSAQVQALEAANQSQERLLQTVRDLSTPAIPIYDGILVLPLVGNIDTGRAGQIMETVLNSIAREHASVVLLDITAVSVIDTDVANHLLQVSRAATLLGARCLLVGIRPEVAHTIVTLGVDLSSIITRADLQSGVSFALAQRGLHIVPLSR